MVLTVTLSVPAGPALIAKAYRKEPLSWAGLGRGLRPAMGRSHELLHKGEVACEEVKLRKLLAPGPDDLREVEIAGLTAVGRHTVEQQVEQRTIAVAHLIAVHQLADLCL